MASELERQVQRIRKEQIRAQSVSHGRASLFLSPAEAAGIDIDVVHEAAHKALMTLMQYDGRFGPFTESLLHPSSVSVQRELKTKEVRAMSTDGKL